MGDADLLIGSSHAAFVGCDIGPALQQDRRHHPRDIRQKLGSLVQRKRRQGKLRGRLADQHRNGMLILRALDFDVGALHAGLVELGSGFCQIRLRRGARPRSDRW